MSNYTESRIPVERDGVMQLQLVKTERCVPIDYEMIMARGGITQAARLLLENKIPAAALKLAVDDYFKLVDARAKR
jgi:hypothetical protein